MWVLTSASVSDTVAVLVIVKVCTSWRLPVPMRYKRHICVWCMHSISGTQQLMCCVSAVLPQVQSRAAYVLFYRRRQQAQQDQPDLVEQLLHQQQQHLQQKWQQQQQEQDQAAAAAVGPNDAASGMETDPGPVLGGSSGAAAAAGPAEGAAAPSSPGQVVEVGTWGSPAVAPSARATSPSGDENNTPASPLPMMPDLSSRAVAARNAAADTSTSTSSRGIRGAEEDADSSDGSSSRRPRGGSRAAAAQSGSGVATELLPIGDPGGDSDSYTPLGAVLQAVAVADRPARRSDQGLDADMADRDV